MVLTIGDEGWTGMEVMALMAREHIELLVDVRSRPSGGTPELDYDQFRPKVRERGVRYSYMGDLFGKLGDAEPDAEKILSGAVRVASGASRWRVLVFGGCEDPRGTTRREVVAWALLQLGCKVKHVRAGGRIEEDPGF